MGEGGREEKGKDWKRDGGGELRDWGGQDTDHREERGREKGREGGRHFHLFSLYLPAVFFSSISFVKERCAGLLRGRVTTADLESLC